MDEYSALVYDSVRVVPGALFVCLTGSKSDGHEYIVDAVNRGAKGLVISEDYCLDPLQEAAIESRHVAVCRVPNTKAELSLLSAQWFRHPADSLILIGITGTKGKTTTAHMVREILTQAGRNCGIIGTNGVDYCGIHIETHNTTPQSYEIQEYLRGMVDAGCDSCVMEVSSQAEKLDRVYGMTFSVGVFLNISPDHIGPGEHADFDEYLDCKRRLFMQVKNAVINTEDPHARPFIDTAERYSANIYTFGMSHVTNMCNTWEPGHLGVRFDYRGTSYHLALPGAFNVSNALAAINVASVLAIPSSCVVEGLAHTSVTGRCQLISSRRSTYIVDYAHNAVALKALLEMLRGYSPARLIVLFGAGGNRDPHRRFEMGAVAAALADLTIITSDNPRFEEPESIIADIVTSFAGTAAAYETITDRGAAIRRLVEISRHDDICVIAGKGHEDYIEVRGERSHFSDAECVQEALEAYET